MECEKCKKQYKNKGSFEKHKIACSNNNGFICEFCETKFNTKFSMNRHSSVCKEKKKDDNSSVKETDIIYALQIKNLILEKEVAFLKELIFKGQKV